ncbi:MAG: DnaJ domain-containing protein [Chitinophagales bacterium]|nr:DnaJ domain-containing protein [Chitinophagales bacterium]
MQGRDYYAVLELEHNASLQDIKASFRRLALRYHPDRNSSAGASDKFNEINRAYEVLADVESRRQYDLSLNIGRPNYNNTFHEQTVYITDRVWLKVSRSKVRVNTSFSVVIRSFKRANEPTLDGLENFLVVKRYSQIIYIQGRPLRETLYVLKADKEGVFQIGPAKLRQGRYEYISSFIDIEVSNRFSAEKQSVPSRVSFYILVMFGCMLLLNLGYYTWRLFSANGNEHLVEASEHGRTPYSEAFRPATGASVYRRLFGNNAVSKTMNHLRIFNGREFDMVVTLQDSMTNTTIRNHYIRSQESIDIEAIPAGIFFINIESSKGNAVIVGDSLSSVFTIASYERYNQTLDLSKKSGQDIPINFKELLIFSPDFDSSVTVPINAEVFFSTSK